MNFKDELKRYCDIVNKELEKHVKKEKCPEELLNASMEYSLISSGKRLRPILMINTYEMFEKEYENVFTFAVAMEMIHNFSLIHDDLPGIDNDDFRHRKAYKSQKISEKQQRYLQEMAY